MTGEFSEKQVFIWELILSALCPGFNARVIQIENNDSFTLMRSFKNLLNVGKSNLHKRVSIRIAKH